MSRTASDSPSMATLEVAAAEEVTKTRGGRDSLLGSQQPTRMGGVTHVVLALCLGVLMGGGRDNIVRGSYFERCRTAGFPLSKAGAPSAF